MMNTANNDPDHVFQRAGWWYVMVDYKVHGAWRSKAEAIGGLQVEQRRAAKRCAVCGRNEVEEYADGSNCCMHTGKG